MISGGSASAERACGKNPNDTIKNEITTFNNQAHALLPKKERPKPRQLIKPEEMIKAGGRGGRGGRR